MSTPAIDPKENYTSEKLIWRTIEIEVRHCVGWARDVGIDHVEIYSKDRVHLPITETGYKSHFIHAERIAEIGTAAEYMVAWLDHEAQTKSWKKYEQDSKQLSLF